MQEWTKRNPKFAVTLILGALVIATLMTVFAVFVLIVSPNRSVAPQLFLGAVVPAVPFAAAGIGLAVACRRARSSLMNAPRASSEESRADVGEQPPRSYNRLAITGFVLAFGSTFIGLFVSIAALIQIRRTGQEGRRLALAGVWISSAAIGLGTVALVVSGMQGLLPWQY